MAFTAFILNREGVFAFVVAGSARLASFHVGHGHFPGAGLEREDFGVAVSAFVILQMELMAEDGITGRGFKGYFARREAFMALGAVSGGKGGFAIVAGTTELALVHTVHGDAATTLFHDKQLGVTIGTRMLFDVTLMIKGKWNHSFFAEFYCFRCW